MIDEIIRLSFLKYKLSGRRSMNTFIFSEVKKNELTDVQIDAILDILEKKIKKYDEEKNKKNFVLDFTLNGNKVYNK